MDVTVPSQAGSAEANSSMTLTDQPTESTLVAPSDFLSHLPSSKATAQGSELSPSSTSIDGPPVAGAPKPQVDAHGRALHPRSCVTCRKRKVKCDKTHPCANCNRAHIECVFPSPGRAPRKVRKPADGRDKELLERLRRLEGVVKGMGAEVPNSDKSGESRENGGSSGGVNGSNISSTGTPSTSESKDVPTTSVSNGATTTGCQEKTHTETTQFVDGQQAGRFENRFGRLVVNDGKSRYINNSFWANLSNEVEDLKGILNQSSDDEELEASPESASHIGPTHQGWIFGFSSQNVDLLSLHPLPSQLQTYWEIYKSRVDPLVKVLHIPTIEPTVLAAASHLSTVPKGFEALLFAIYYGATTSLSSDECFTKFGEEKAVMLSRYRFAIEQALARANFLTTEEIVVLQAFIIFLICLRRNNDARVIWTLTGLIVRISQTIGIHRDGSHFGLKPFEIEIRRRLWWQVCILDTRASEDHGCDPTIIEHSFDTKLPLNINDADISPEATEFPPERQGCTDMSFCLIRFEMANTFRRINYIPPAPPSACGRYLASVTLQDKEKWITECHHRLEERYLKHCDMSVPMFWVTATVARLMMSKMWLMVYHPFQRQDGGASLTKETRERLFITSLENIEYSLLLETEARTMQWGWLFKTYMQWHALAFLLSALCNRTTGDLVDRAWVAVDKTRDGRWGMQITEDTRAGHLWRPLKKLYRKAREARQRGLRDEALAKQRAAGINIPPRTYSPNVNPMFRQTTQAPPLQPSASLNQDQLRQFTEPAKFGSVPFDKHELLKSPSNSEHSEHDIQPMNSNEESNSNNSNRPAMFSPFGSEGSIQSSTNGFTSSNFDNPNSRSNVAGSHSGAIGHVGVVDLSDSNNNNMDYVNHHHQQQQHSSLGESTNNNDNDNRLPRADSLDSNGFDMSGMDTSGDMNWENWDQLVRQFGMDIDGSPDGNGGVAADWGGGNWNIHNSLAWTTSQTAGGIDGSGVNGSPAMRMNGGGGGGGTVGMGMGDWF